MSIETKLLFPLARLVFIVVAMVCFILGALGLFASLTSVFKSSSQPVDVAPQRILSTVQPFSTANHMAQEKGSPFTAAVSKSSELRRRYPNTDVDKVFDYLIEDPSLDKMSAYAMLEGYLLEAESEGDDVRSYLNNALKVLQSEGLNSLLRGRAFEAYHKVRLAHLRQARQQRSVKEEEQRTNLLRSTVFIVIALQASLILALLAIERNTRGYRTS